MTFIYFKYICANCSNIFKLPGFMGDQHYGEFLMRSKSGDAVYLDAFNDAAFQEMKKKIFYNNKKVKKINKIYVSQVFQSVFSLACDPDAEGNSYHIGFHPHCPICKSSKMSTWGPTNPPEPYEKFIKPVTHDSWNKLTEQEKEKLVDEAITDYLNNADKEPNKKSIIYLMRKIFPKKYI